VTIATKGPVRVVGAGLLGASVGLALVREGVEVQLSDPSRTALALAREEAGSPLAAFLLNGWYLDTLYRLLLIRPFAWLARILWKGVDEAGIDATLDGLARFTARLGQLPAAWSSGRVATSLFALAAGVCVVLAYLVWVTLP